MIEKEHLLENTREVSKVFRTRLDKLKSECELIRDVRVLGVMIGVELSIDGAPMPHWMVLPWCRRDAGPAIERGQARRRMPGMVLLLALV